MQNYNSVDEESSLLGTNANPTPAPAPRSAISSRVTIAAISALALLGLGAFLSSTKSGASNASTDLASAKAPLDSVKQSSTELASAFWTFKNSRSQTDYTSSRNRNDDWGNIGQLAVGFGPTCRRWKQPLVEVRYKNVGNHEWEWQFKCSGDLNTPFTPVNGDWGWGEKEQDNGRIEYLDRQRFFCPHWTYMSEFSFEKVHGKVKLNGACINYDNQADYETKDMFTGWKPKPGYPIFDLEPHWIKCEDGWALVGFEGLTRDDWSNGNRDRFVNKNHINGGYGGDNRFQFHYICGRSKVNNAPYPTANPTPRPTPVPISNPTAAPSPLPTTAPSPVPISDPTTAPTPVPIANPTASPHSGVSVFGASSAMVKQDGRGALSGNNILTFGSFPIPAFPDCKNGYVSPEYVLAGFHFNYDGRGGYFERSCTSIKNDLYTPYDGDYYKTDTEQAVGGLEFLDRQHIKAGPGGFLSQWYFTTKNSQLQANYYVRKFANVVSFNYVDYYAGWGTKGDLLIYFDRYTVACPDGFALNMWEGITSTRQTENLADKKKAIPEKGNDDFNIHYICVSAMVSAVPSPAPTPLPTLVPISDPTTEPSPVPISNPTAVPISDPTVAPTEAPISDPTAVPISLPTTLPTEYPISDPTEVPTESPVSVPDDVIDGHRTCAFVFTKGVSPDVPPAGVVLIADKDINFLKPGQVSNAAYVAGSSVEITGASLVKYLILDKISTIVPGASTKVTFYSGENLEGLEYTFTPKSYQALTNFHYHGSNNGNDDANSMKVSSTTDASLPSDCVTYKRLKIMKD